MNTNSAWVYKCGLTEHEKPLIPLKRRRSTKNRLCKT